MFWSEDVGIISRSEYPDNKFLWTLPNCFASWDPYDNNKIITNSVVCSPWFSSYNTKWRLALVHRHNGYEFVGMFLWKTPSSSLSPRMTATLGLFHTDIQEREFEGELNSHGCFGKWDFLQLSEFNHSADAIAADGLLRFFCEMRLKTEILQEVPLGNNDAEEKDVDEGNISKEIPESKGVDRLVQDLKNLLLNGQISDLTLKVDDREFKVHRNVLIVRSPVFASMLQHDTKENATGIVDIPDCSVKAFEVFLSYIYSGSADNISSDNVFDLYYVADKYQISDLKYECVEFMEENLSIENFCVVMTLSLRHSESGLLKKATEFFCDNVKLIIKTVQWQNYVKDYPVQANELYIKAMNA